MKIITKIIYKLILFIVCISMIGCVSMKVPNKETRASRKMGKHLSAIRRITNVYPDLVDSVKTPTMVLVQAKPDTLFTPSLNIDYTGISNALKLRDLTQNRIDSIQSIIDSDDPGSDEIIKLQAQIRIMEEEILNDIASSIFKDTTVVNTKIFTLNIGDATIDLKVVATTIVRNGNPSTSFTLGQINQKVEVLKEETFFTVYQKMKFNIFQKIFFYILLIGASLLAIWKYGKKVVS